MEFQDVVRRRRMVRTYSDEPVDPDVVERILANALHAPSAGFTQGLGVPAARRPPTSTGSGRPAPRRAPRRPRTRGCAGCAAPVVIVPLSNKSAYLGRYAEADKGWTDRDEARWPVPYWHMDTAMASLLMLLTAVDARLGACFFGIPVSAPRRSARSSGCPRSTPRSVRSRSGTAPEPRRPGLGRARPQARRGGRTAAAGDPFRRLAGVRGETDDRPGEPGGPGAQAAPGRGDRVHPAGAGAPARGRRGGRGRLGPRPADGAAGALGGPAGAQGDGAREFDDLPGAGKPIRGLDGNHDPNWWVKSLIEREQITGVLPPALALRKEDAELDGALDREASEDEVRRAVEDFNRRVVDARRRCSAGRRWSPRPATPSGRSSRGVPVAPSAGTGSASCSSRPRDVRMPRRGDTASAAGGGVAVRRADPGTRGQPSCIGIRTPRSAATATASS